MTVCICLERLFGNTAGKGVELRVRNGLLLGFPGKALWGCGLWVALRLSELRMRPRCRCLTEDQEEIHAQPRNVDNLEGWAPRKITMEDVQGQHPKTGG